MRNATDSHTSTTHSDIEEAANQAAQNPYVITSAYRTLQVLKSFATPPHSFSLSELISQTGLEKNQLYRSLKTLESAHFLAVGPDGRFKLTALLHDLSAASVHMARQSVVEIAQPYLDEVVAKTGESVNLFVRSGMFAVCVDRRDSPQQVKLTSVLGVSAPLHAGAVPKAMLAFLGDKQQAKVFEQLATLPKYTGKTVLDPEVLKRDLQLIRERGYSVSDEDYDASARGVGAPIFDAQQDVVAGISVGGPSFRVDDASLHAFGLLITRVARAISQRLGYLG